MSQPFYTSDAHWSHARPQSLVICCSDGRLQKSADEFLQNRLGIFYYDKLYAPGGPAALAESSAPDTRAELFRSDMKFLFDAHAFSRIILLFHGAAGNGPADGVCAHYRRLIPDGSYDEVARRQAADKANVLRYLAATAPDLQVEAYRAEVLPDLRVQFVELA